MLAEKYADRIAKVFAKYPTKRSAVMPLLYIAQEEYGYVTQQALDEVAALCDLDPTQVKSIAGFYTMYRERAKGKYWLHVCTDLACALRGADQFYEDLVKELGLDPHADHEIRADEAERPHADTTADGLFTVEHVMCLGACDRAPMLQCNFHFYENLDMEKMRALLAKWRTEAQG